MWAIWAHWWCESLGSPAGPAHCCPLGLWRSAYSLTPPRGFLCDSHPNRCLLCRTLAFPVCSCIACELEDPQPVDWNTYAASSAVANRSSSSTLRCLSATQLQGLQQLDLRFQSQAGLRSYLLISPEGPSTQYLRILVPNTIKGMVFGASNLKHWVSCFCYSS